MTAPACLWCLRGGVANCQVNCRGNCLADCRGARAGVAFGVSIGGERRVPDG